MLQQEQLMITSTTSVQIAHFKLTTKTIITIQECMFVDSGFIIIEEFTSTESEDLKL